MRKESKSEEICWIWAFIQLTKDKAYDIMREIKDDRGAKLKSISAETLNHL